MSVFLLTIEYDGTAYYGWQRQANGHTSIQEILEVALFQIVGENVRIYSSGRTDAGVHALAQTAHFTCKTRLSPQTFMVALNSMLPFDIRIHSCVLASDDFHARFSSSRKTYRYVYYTHPVAPTIGRQYCWYLQKPLDVATMHKAAQNLVGEHDFAAFEGAGSPRTHTTRIIYEAKVEKKDLQVFFEITGNGFLRFMVRNIAGTLADIGHGKRSVSDISSLLDSGNRSQAGITAPSQGLFLLSVSYENDPRNGLEAIPTLATKIIF